MNTIKALGSGVVGAVSLTILHQLLKNTSSEAPRVDKLGMNAISTGLKKLGIEPPENNRLFKASLAGDLIFNSIYYSFVATGKFPLLSSSLLGVGAGIGSVALPGPMGLDEAYTNRTSTTKALSIAIYLLGGLAAGLTYKALMKKTD